jgi:type IX secretion system PorP/SprF family membrane protein
MFRKLLQKPDSFSMTVLLLLMIWLIASDMKAQDLHYSQFYNSPLNTSPALTGIFNGDQRFMFSFRDQGRNIPVPYLTFTASYDRKIYPASNTDGFFGIGGFINYDEQGDSNLRLINVNATASYSRLLDEHNILTGGILLGFANRGFDPENLMWDSQWDPVTGMFNSNAGSGENFDFENFSFLETAIGLNYRWQSSTRTRIDIGAAGWHLNEPESNFSNSVDQSLPLRMSFYGIGSIQLDERLDFQLDILHQRQDAYRQLLFGGYLNYYLNQARGRVSQFRAGAGYKTTGEILFVKAGFQTNELFVGASYDIDLSEFGVFDEGSPGRGPELHLRYIIKHVKPKGRFKICPIF